MDGALDLEEQAIGIANEIGHQQWLSAATMMRGIVHADLLDYAAARPDLERAVEARKRNGLTALDAGRRGLFGFDTDCAE